MRITSRNGEDPKKANLKTGEHHEQYRFPDLSDTQEPSSGDMILYYLESRAERPAVGGGCILV
jgi:hypothetical protein